MTLEVLSSIKGARSSEAVEKLFEAIKQANAGNSALSLNNNQAVGVNELREDVVMESSAVEKQIIRSNFPKSKNGYLLVSKVIEE